MNHGTERRVSRAWLGVLASVGLGLGVFAAVPTAGAAPPDGPEPRLAPAAPPIPMTMPGPDAGTASGAPATPAPTLEPPPASAPAAPEATPPAPAPAAPAQVSPAPFAAAPAARVYVLNGVDAFGWARLREMADRLGANGYETRYGQWYQARQFEREIRQMHSQQPGTPVAIVGYSLGSYRAKSIANRLTRDGIPVAMVGYVGGDYLRNSPSDVPGGTRVVNVTGNGFLLSGRNLFFNGTDISGAQNLRLGVKHFDLPKQQQTVDALLAGLGGTAGSPAPALEPQPAAAPATAAYTPAPVAMQPDSVQPHRSSSGNRPLFRLVGRGDR